MENNTENVTEDFSPEESLQVIQSMIDQTKNSVADNSFYFLLWGWLVLIGALLQYTLKVIVRTEQHPGAWFIMFIGFILSIFHKVKERDRKVKTYVDAPGRLGYRPAPEISAIGMGSHHLLGPGHPDDLCRLRHEYFIIGDSYSC